MLDRVEVIGAQPVEKVPKVVCGGSDAPMSYIMTSPKHEQIKVEYTINHPWEK